MTRQSETSDAYPYVVVDFGDGWRVIGCAAGLQWVVQRRMGSGLYPWRGVSYCRTKEALLRCACHSHPSLEALPDWFTEARETAREAYESEFEVLGVA